jgi:hypothetical protein
MEGKYPQHVGILTSWLRVLSAYVTKGLRVPLSSLIVLRFPLFTILLLFQNIYNSTTFHVYTHPFAPTSSQDK